MKRTKKVFSVLLALVMVLAMQMTSFATSVTIDDENDKEASVTYRAFKLMTATAAEDGTQNDDSDDRYSYTVNPKYSKILQQIVSTYTTPAVGEASITDEKVIEYLESIKDRAALVQDFALQVYAALVNEDGSLKLTDLKKDKDYVESTSKTFTLEQGYYLIEEVAHDSGAVSRVMLDTAGLDDVTIKTKEDVPTLEKKVQEINDSKATTDNGNPSDWQDAADYDIGDKIPFQLKANLAGQNYGAYSEYTLIFHDKMSDGLTMDPANMIKHVYADLNRNGQFDEGEGYNDNDYHLRRNLGDGCSFEVVIDDIKSVVKDSSLFVQKGGVNIIVEYELTLNENAKVGSNGNDNEAHLEYSNNPYGDGTGTTPKDLVTVFTYQLDVTKVDGAENHQPLAGAEFTLQKKDATGQYVDVKTVSGEGQNGNEFTFKGLDAGDYKLVESIAPNGYNKADDIFFTVTGVYDTNKEDPQLTELKVTLTDESGKTIEEDAGKETFTVSKLSDDNSGHIATTVINNFGSELPSTGGIGTTIFYIVGGILVVAAAVLLVVKKRLSHTA